MAHRHVRLTINTATVQAANDAAREAGTTTGNELGVNPDVVDAIVAATLNALFETEDIFVINT